MKENRLAADQRLLWHQMTNQLLHRFIRQQHAREKDVTKTCLTVRVLVSSAPIINRNPKHQRNAKEKDATVKQLDFSIIVA